MYACMQGGTAQQAVIISTDIFMSELSLGNISDRAYAGVLDCVRGVQNYTETVMSL